MLQVERNVLIVLYYGHDIAIQGVSKTSLVEYVGIPFREIANHNSALGYG